jgi:hypothetical protein
MAQAIAVAGLRAAAPFREAKDATQMRLRAPWYLPSA